MPRSTRAWSGLAACLVLVGIAGSVLAAGSVARTATERARRRFEANAAEVASTLRLSIQHEEDLVSAAWALADRNEGLNSDELQQWVRDIEAFERYPELQGIAVGRWVTPAELPALGLNPVPPGVRDHYCLTPVGVSRDNPLPPNVDTCTDKIGEQALIDGRDTGKVTYAPVKIQGMTWLAIEEPLYRGGVLPGSLEQRRARFYGWLGVALYPKIVIDRALVGHRDLSVRVRYDHLGSDIRFASGVLPKHAPGVVSDLRNGWRIDTFGPSTHASVLDGAARSILVGGVLFSLLLGAFIAALTSGRARAERLVREKTDELRHQALHDPLTGLANRALLLDRIEQLLARARRNRTHGAVLYLDLDGFKGINDTLGHTVGDELLRAVAERLSTAVREADTIARLGSDEFVVLIDGDAIGAAPEFVADRLLAVLRQPFELDGVEPALRLSASIGIAIGDRDSATEMLRDADVALYRSKAAGRDCFHVFRPEMIANAREDLQLELDLRSALANDELRLVYQPVYNLDDLTLVSVEALLRWQHPTRGLLEPDRFVPILERTGAIVPVGRWVLREASERMARWRAMGSRLAVSVNVSARQFQGDAIVADVRDALADSGLDPDALVLEITESALVQELDETAERLRRIKGLGVRVAVDDFGTGYSSLAYLQCLPVDCLKIDRSFIKAVAGSPESQALVRTIVQLGRELGLKTLAEGVETPAQVDRLRGEHVDEAQGFLLAQPLDAGELERTILFPLLTAVQDW